MIESKRQVRVKGKLELGCEKFCFSFNRSFEGSGSDLLALKDKSVKV